MNFFQKYAAGGALRPDSFTGMNPDFSTALQSMIAGAPADVQQALQIYSGYRSPQKQQQLWNDALAKYGSPEAARKWVAPPGRSNHNHGLAADLKFLGDGAKSWVHDNASNYGLAFPLANEPWHVELASARGGKPANAGAAINAQMAPGAQPKTIAAEPMDRPAAITAMAPEQSGGTSMAAGPKMPQGIGGLGGLGGFVPPQPDDGFDTGGLLRALAAAAFAGDASVIPQMLSQSEAQRDKRYDRQYDRAWDQYTLGARQQESALDRQARADDRADNNRFREADDRRADASLKLQQEVAGRKDVGATDDTREYEYAVGRGYTGSFPEWQLAQRRAGASSVTIGGGENKQVFDAMAESASGARAAVSGLKAIRDARQAIDAGGIFGAGADTRLGLQKIGAYLGVSDPAAITNTETFRAAIAPQVSAVLKSTVGSANISNTDREFAEKAAGGNITLEPTSIKRLLTIMEKASNEAVAGHASRLDRVYPAGDQFERERALFGVDMPDMTAAPIDPPNTGGRQQNASGAPAKPTSDEEYNALPSGSLFIDPDDGKTYRKP